MGSLTRSVAVLSIVCIEPSIFSAGRDQPLDNSQVIVRYPTVLSNLGSDFSVLTSLYTAPSSGDYIFVYGCGTRQLSTTQVSLRVGVTDYYNILADTSIYNGYSTFSRAQVMTLNSHDEISNHMVDHTKLYSSRLLESYLSGFQLDVAMTSVVAFSAGMINDVSTTGTIKYDVINYDNLGGYNPTTGAYLIPNMGYYYISVTIATAAYTKATVSVNSNTGGDLFQVVSTATNNDGVMMGSNGLMFMLAGGSSVTLRLNSGALYSDLLQQVSLNLFEYTPASSQPIAWSVYTPFGTTADGDINPFPYPEAIVNTYGGYSFTNLKVTIMEAGYYFIHVNAGSVANVTTDMELFAGSWSWVAGTGQGTTNCDGQLTLGRDLILPLDVGDEVYVKLVDKTAESSGESKLTSFTGFLLYMT